MSYRCIDDLDINLWRALTKLYLSDPLTHCYLMYDTIYALDDTKVCVVMDGDNIKSYVLIWRGRRIYGIHLWGDILSLLDRVEIPRDQTVFLHLYTDDIDIVTKAVEYLKSQGLEFKLTYFYDMVTDEKSFNPYKPELARRLTIDDIDQFIELKHIQGRIVDRDEAIELINKNRYYGVFIDNKLVSIACRYIALPEIWVIGDVYTHPDYRGRGYAKIVTSAITRDAVNSGAKALLHVEENNNIAISVYRKLGYRVVARKAWIVIK